MSTDGTYTLNVPDINTTWIVEGRANGYETNASSRQEVAISGSSETGVNLVLSRIQRGGQDYQIKPPEVKSMSPSTGGVIDNTQTGVKVVIPANALGSSSEAGQVTMKETTGVAQTNYAKPAGGVGKEIKAVDSEGSDGTVIADM